MVGTKVMVRITHAGTIFVAQGKVAYSRPGARIGIGFTSTEPSSVSCSLKLRIQLDTIAPHLQLLR